MESYEFYLPLEVPGRLGFAEWWSGVRRLHGKRMAAQAGIRTERETGNLCRGNGGIHDTSGAPAWFSVRVGGEWRLQSPPWSWVGGRAKGERVGMVRAYKIIFSNTVFVVE